ncbi:MAG: phosphodiester glycosidase family protein [Gaiellaceae bacterium]
MLKRLLIVAVLAGVLAGPAQPQFTQALLMPGVGYSRQVHFTAYGPVAIHVITAPRPTGAYALKPVLSNGAILGRERVTTMQQALSAEYTVAGVNGDLFAWADGRPSGMLLRSGVIDHAPLPERSAIGITADGTLKVDRLRMFGTWRGVSQRRPMEINNPPGPNGVSLYTSAWGPATPPGQGTLEATIYPLPPTTTGADLAGPVIQVTQNGSTPIPAGGAVIVARGTGAQRFAEEAPVGTNVTFRFLLNPDWPAEGVVDAIGGGPVLVRDGKPVFRHFEGFTSAQLARNPRTGVGQLADGRILLVVVDGRQRGYSVGMTNFELALTMMRLGAVTASSLDAGGSSTIAFDGKLLNRPSDRGGERAVSECLCLLYNGIYAPPATEAVLSPNGDGVGEVQGLAYKVTRASTVTVSLVGPDGLARQVETGPKEPGLYQFDWTGAAEPEGRWRYEVLAVDEAGATTSAAREFSLNRTVAGLSLQVRQRPRNLTASFTLARAARVTLRLETRAGAVVATAARRQLAAGPQTVVWKVKARAGRYVLRVIARNELGSMDLTQPLSLRR